MTQVDAIAGKTEHKAGRHWWRGPEFAVTFMWTLVLTGTIALGATVGNLTLTGSVPLLLDLAVTPAPASTSLDLGTLQTTLRVADVTVHSNSASGYAVAVRSNNVANAFCASPCFYSTTTTDALPFSLSRDGIAINFAGDTGTFASSPTVTGTGGDLHTAQVTYDGTSSLLGQANNYGEILTFTVTLN